MLLCSWHKLPPQMRNESVRFYYDILSQKKVQLLAKRLFDFILSSLMLVVLSPLFLIIPFAIKLDSMGPVFFMETRVTSNGKLFKIFKFRTMCENAEYLGAQVTSYNDKRVTKIGKFLRRYRLDEIPQLLNIINGDMSFVGTRPEVPRYVDKYTPEQYATLLLPAGVTSLCCIEFKDEEKLISESSDPDKTYVEEILPQKMILNLCEVKNFNLVRQFFTCIDTILAIVGLRITKTRNLS